MLRILLIALVIAMVIAVLNRARSMGKNGRDESANSLPLKMVKCTYCEVHVRQQDALESNGQYYCSIEHQKKAEIEDLS